MTLEPARPEMQADFPRFSPDEYARRYAHMRELMATRNLDALIIWGESSGWGELSGARTGMASARYVSNFADQLTEYVLFPKTGDPILFTFSRSHSTCARGISVIPIEFAHLEIALAVSERMGVMGASNGTIGLVGLSTLLDQSLPSDQYDRLKAEMPNATFVVATDLLEEVRRIKSAEELDWIARSVAFTDTAFRAVLQGVAAGKPEFELHADVARSYLPAGGHLNFQALAATPMSKPQILSPGYHKTRRAFAPGDVMHAELSAGYWGYGGYVARPIAIGGPPSEAMRKCFDVALNALNAVSAAIRPGENVERLYREFRTQLPPDWTNAGPVVRGWGLAIEPPYVDEDGAIDGAHTLSPGMILALTANPISPDRSAGLRLGDLFLVTNSGADRLQAAPLEFFNAG